MFVVDIETKDPGLHNADGGGGRQQSAQAAATVGGGHNSTMVRKKVRIWYTSMAAASLVIGIAIYGLFRKLDIVLFRLIPKPLFLSGEYTVTAIHNKILSIMIYNLPDGLWFLSCLFIIRALWLTNKKWHLVYFSGFTVLAFAMEISQMFKDVSGTFDVLDLFFMGIMAFLEGLIFSIFINRRIV